MYTWFFAIRFKSKQFETGSNEILIFIHFEFFANFTIFDLTWHLGHLRSPYTWDPCICIMCILKWTVKIHLIDLIFLLWAIHSSSEETCSWISASIFVSPGFAIFVIRLENAFNILSKDYLFVFSYLYMYR